MCPENCHSQKKVVSPCIPNIYFQVLGSQSSGKKHLKKTPFCWVSPVKQPVKNKHMEHFVSQATEHVHIQLLGSQNAPKTNGCTLKMMGF